MLGCNLRVHHALCIQFFKGKGYSSEFVRAMYDRIDYLNNENPLITLCSGCDIICESCPNNIGGECKDKNKVEKIDKRVFKAIGLKAGDRIRWSELKALAYDHIIPKKKIKETCIDCKWMNLCVTEGV